MIFILLCGTKISIEMIGNQKQYLLLKFIFLFDLCHLKPLFDRLYRKAMISYEIFNPQNTICTSNAIYRSFETLLLCFHWWCYPFHTSRNFFYIFSTSGHAHFIINLSLALSFLFFIDLAWARRKCSLYCIRW